MTAGNVPSGACFVAGTRVHVEGGTVPIEQVQVGDLVLALVEDGAAPTLQRVTRTVRHDDAHLVFVVLFPDDTSEQHCLICTTGTALHWTAHRSFNKVSDPTIFQGPEVTSLVRECAFAYGAWPVRETDTPGVAWSNTDEEDYCGPVIDLRGGGIEVSDFFPGSQPDGARDAAYAATVHRIEVAALAWYAGDLGICVSAA